MHRVGLALERRAPRRRFEIGGAHLVQHPDDAIVPEVGRV